MKVITLYKYAREDGKFTVSPNKPEGKEFTEMYRLVADEGMTLTHDGEIIGAVIDTDTAKGWSEVEEPESTET